MIKLKPMLREGAILDASKKRVESCILKELEKIRREAETDHKTFEYQTALYTLLKHIQRD